MSNNRLLFLVPLVMLAAACSAPVQKPAVAPNPAAANPAVPSAVAAAPASAPAAANPAAPSMEIRFAVAGDVMAHGPQIKAAYDKKCDCYDFKPTFATAAPLFQGVDVAIANLETTLPGKN